MKTPKDAGGSTIYLPILYALVVLALLLLSIIGGKLYLTLTESSQANDNQRTSLAYVQTRVAAADESGGVTVEEGPEGAALVLREGDTGYETRIYLYDSQLVEELSPVDRPLSPEIGAEICMANSFSVEQLPGGMLTLTVDGQHALICLHSGGGTSDDSFD